MLTNTVFALIALIGLVLPMVVNAQTTGQSPGSLSCVDSLQIPQYPPLARSARFAGTVHVQAVLVGGSLTELKIDGAHRLLQDEVEKTLRAARFSAACDHPSLDLFFVFKIEGAMTGADDRGVVTFVRPNEFTIIVRPPTPQP